MILIPISMLPIPNHLLVLHVFGNTWFLATKECKGEIFLTKSFQTTIVKFSNALYFFEDIISDRNNIGSQKKGKYTNKFQIFFSIPSKTPLLKLNNTVISNSSAL